MEEEEEEAAATWRQEVHYSSLVGWLVGWLVALRTSPPLPPGNMYDPRSSIVALSF